MRSILQPVGIGVVIVLAGSIPRDIVYFANLRVLPQVPWAVVVMAVFVWLFWRYLDGASGPEETRQFRHMNLRARPLSPQVWIWAMATGLLGLAALVFGLRVENRMVTLPPQTMPDLSAVPRYSIFTLLLASAPIAGIIEEAAFRGYMQKPLEERYGLPRTILITGTMFALVHLDFTWVLWPYYIAVSAIYGTVSYHTRSILPAIALHTLGNTYSNFDLLLHGRADWQAGPVGAPLVWQLGPDAEFWWMLAGFVFTTILAVWATRRLAQVAVTSASGLVSASK